MTATESSFDKARRKMVAARIEFMGQLAKFSKAALKLTPTQGEWSPLQLAHHLYIADGLALEQMRRVQEEDNPLVTDLSVETPHLTRTSEPPVSLDAVLGGMAARREELYEYLSALSDDAWVRPYRHENGGQYQFYQLVNVLPAHDKQHAQQLTEMRERANGG